MTKRQEQPERRRLPTSFHCFWRPEERRPVHCVRLRQGQGHRRRHPTSLPHHRAKRPCWRERRGLPSYWERREIRDPRVHHPGRVHQILSPPGHRPGRRPGLPNRPKDRHRAVRPPGRWQPELPSRLEQREHFQRHCPSRNWRAAPRGPADDRWPFRLLPTDWLREERLGREPQNYLKTPNQNPVHPVRRKPPHRMRVAAL